MIVYSSAPTDGLTDAVPSFAAASTMLGPHGMLSLPPGVYRVAESMTFACSVEFAPGAMLLRDSGVTVTFAGMVRAGLQQIDADASRPGNLIFGPATVQAILPEWFGGRRAAASAAAMTAQRRSRKPMMRCLRKAVAS